jgi:hypothetical protein
MCLEPLHRRPRALTGARIESLHLLSFVALSVALPVAPPAVRTGEAETCATVRFYTTGNDGPAWIPSNVCVSPSGLSVDEQTIATDRIAVQCNRSAAALVMGGSMLRGEPEWWIRDTTETLKFRGKPEDLERLSAALIDAGGDIPRGACSDRAIRRLLSGP